MSAWSSSYPPGSNIYSVALSTQDSSLGVSEMSPGLSDPGACLSSDDIRHPTLFPSAPIRSDGSSALSTLDCSPSPRVYSAHSLTHVADLSLDGTCHPPDGFSSSSSDLRRPPSLSSPLPLPPFSFDSSPGSIEGPSRPPTPEQGHPSNASWALNRSVGNSFFHGPEKSLQLRARSAVNDKIPMPSLLTAEILTVVDDALSDYEAVRMQCPPEESCPTELDSFSSLSAEDLERYFAAAVDAKDALQLRTSIVAVDIGDALACLLPKLSMHDRDEAALQTISEEMRLIRAECCSRSLPLDFFALEFFRRRLPLHRPSVLERYSGLFSTMERAVDEKADAQNAAWNFLKDPSSLREHRPYYSTLHR